jgi:energy-coupling factor transporter ATP-binding protein EcfA2
MRISSIKFDNFKALRNYSAALKNINILVGPNNSGKSTIIAALRCLETALRRANNKSAELIVGPQGREWGYKIPNESIPMSLENVHSDYGDLDALVSFRLSDNKRLKLYFPISGGCYLLTENAGKKVQRPVEFRRIFPLSITAIPVLGPVEHNEALLEKATISRNLSTHRASRHFRNYWYLNPEEFDEFAALVRKTWPGMDIKRPEKVQPLSDTLSMFCSEDGIDREIYWAGFGFQIWCQLLTHIERGRKGSLVIVDEPETYLHPEVQRQLMQILRDFGPDIILATHSTEIIGEANPSEIIIIDKSQNSARRVHDIEEVQAVYNTIGSIQDVRLTHLARTRKILYVEGKNDIHIIRRLAQKLGYSRVTDKDSLTVLEGGGFSSKDRIRALAEELERVLGTSMRLAAVFDRDYWPIEHLNAELSKLENHLYFAHFHERKEIENYLLQPLALERALKNVLKHNQSIDQDSITTDAGLNHLMNEVTERYRDEAQSQYLSYSALHRSHLDQSTVNLKVIKWFNDKWSTLPERLTIVPGKKVLSDLRTSLQERFSITLSITRIIDSMHLEEIPEDMKKLIVSLDNFIGS